jgi:hypothetical protein
MIEVSYCGAWPPPLLLDVGYVKGGWWRLDEEAHWSLEGCGEDSWLPGGGGGDMARRDRDHRYRMYVFRSTVEARRQAPHIAERRDEVCRMNIDG